MAAKQVAASNRNPVIDDHKGYTEQYSRNYPRQKKAGHRYATVGYGVDNHQNTGRNDRPNRCCGCTDGAGIVRIIAGFAHHAHDDSTGTGRVRQGRTADAGKQHADQDINMAQSPPNVSDEIVGKTQQRAGQSARRHNFCRQDKKWDSHQRKRTDPVKQILGYYQCRKASVDQHGD